MDAELTRPITMDDVRLGVGEGKLSPMDVLAGCNLELRRRARRNPSEQAGEVEYRDLVASLERYRDQNFSMAAGPIGYQLLTKAAAALSRASTPPVESAPTADAVERAAKIIDPDAWHETLPTDGCGQHWMGRRNKAKRKADAILAALTPATPAGEVEKLRCNLGHETDEPSLGEMVLNYYRQHFTIGEAFNLKERYFAALSLPAQREG